jgi:hypothetical protein
VVFAQLLQHVNHTAYGACGRACGVSRISPQVWHSVKGAVQIAGAIDQQQGFFVGCHKERLSEIESQSIVGYFCSAGRAPKPTMSP